MEKSAIPPVEEFSKGSRNFFLREFNYCKPLEAVRNDSDSVDICYGGWLFFGWVHENDANGVQKGKEPNLGNSIVIKPSS